MINPLPGYVLIEPIEEEAKSGDVYLPEVSKDKPMKGKVVVVGKGMVPYQLVGDPKAHYYSDSPVKKGQTVIYKKWTNQEIEHDGKNYLLIKFDELLGVVE